MRRFVAYLQLLQPMEGETADEIDVRVEIETEVEEGEDPPPGSPETEPETHGSSAVAEPEPPTPPEPAASTERASDAADPEDAERAAKLDEAVRRLVIPDDPTTLSYLLSGIIQVDPARRQHLLEAATTEERLVLLDKLIDRELWMLRRRLRFYAPDDRQAAVRRN